MCSMITKWNGNLGEITTISFSDMLRKVCLNVYPVTVLPVTIMADIKGHMTNQLKYIQKVKVKKMF